MGGASQIAVGAFLAACCGWVRTTGFVSRKMLEGRDGGMTTGDLAWEQFQPDCKKADRVEVTPADEARAAAIIVWGAALQPRDDNNYENNLKLLLAAPTLARSGAGYVASAVVAYDRAMGKLLERAQQAPSEHVGVVGERSRHVVTCFAAIGIDSDQFGYSTLYVLRTDKNELLKWKSSGEAKLDRQQRYLLEGSVKEHTEYKDEKQTVLTRCSVLAELGRALKPGMERTATEAAFEVAVLSALAVYEASPKTGKHATIFGLALRKAETEARGEVYVPPPPAPKADDEPELVGEAEGETWAGFEAKLNKKVQDKARRLAAAYGRTKEEAVARLAVTEEERVHMKISPVALLDLTYEERQSLRGKAMYRLAEKVLATHGAFASVAASGNYASAARRYFEAEESLTARLGSEAWVGFLAEVVPSAPAQLQWRKGFGRTAEEASALLRLAEDEKVYEQVAEIRLLDLSDDELRTERGRVMGRVARTLIYNDASPLWSLMYNNKFASAAPLHFAAHDEYAAKVAAEAVAKKAVSLEASGESLTEQNIRLVASLATKAGRL